MPTPAADRGATGNAALADAKVAVLPFEGEEPEQLRKHVIKLLVDRGLQVDSTLEPQDNAIQYRDMGAALNLAVYVHGKMKPTKGDRAVATVTIRSAVTGRPVATAIFNGFRRGLPFDAGGEAVGSGRTRLQAGLRRSQQAQPPPQQAAAHRGRHAAVADHRELARISHSDESLRWSCWQGKRVLRCRLCRQRSVAGRYGNPPRVSINNV